MIEELIKTGAEKPIGITSLPELGRHLELIENSQALSVQTSFQNDGTRVIERRLSDGQWATITLTADFRLLKLEHVGYTPETVLSVWAARANNGNGAEVAIATYESETETFGELIRPLDLYNYVAALLQDVS